MSGPEREVIVIPATIHRGSSKKLDRQLNVAGYCRVSTEQDEQLMSYETQKKYYSELIARTPEWSLAGIYADSGISGATAEKRPDFMKMIRHCKAGKIDLIITKSISRFARNTLDSIGYVRKLKAMGIGVLFEKENINSLDCTSEVILTILSSLAQEELNSLSSNVKMGKRMAMKEGKDSFPYSTIYAFKKGDDGKPEIIPEEAEVVRRIYRRYLAGDSIIAIRDALVSDGVPSPRKKEVWTTATVRNILENERFCGDVILQKTYVTDPISKKVKKNNGELPKVFIKNNHPAIIERSEFERVQLEHARRSSKRKVSDKAQTELGKYSSMYALTEILVCGECGTPYKRIVWTTRGVKKTVWRCTNRYDHGTKYCKNSPTLDEESLHEAIVRALSATRRERASSIAYLSNQLSRSFVQVNPESLCTDQLEDQIRVLKAQVMELMTESISKNTLAENEGRLKEMSDSITALNERLEKKKEADLSDGAVESRLSAITEALALEPNQMGTYDDNLVRQLIETIKVIDSEKLLITFKGGMQFEQAIAPNIRKIRHCR
jgi:DNA invertase Pin-like site-specific DNA recombinase